MAAVADIKFDIWRLQAQGNVRGLSLALKDASPDVRRRAATALRALGASSAIPSLQSVLVTESDPDVRSVIISTLDYLFEQEIEDESDSATEDSSQVVRLIAQLNSPRADHIIRAAQRLGELNEKIAAEALVMVFHNARLPGEVRLAAAEALVKLESAPVEVSLLAALRHADWRVRRNAAAVLGQLHADWASLPLGEALKDEHEIVRRTALAALKRFDTPEAQRIIDRMMAAMLSAPAVPDDTPKPASTTLAQPAADAVTEPATPATTATTALTTDSAPTQPATTATTAPAPSNDSTPTQPAPAATSAPAADKAAQPQPAPSSPAPVQPPAPPARPQPPSVSTATLPTPAVSAPPDGPAPAQPPAEGTPPAAQPPRASVQTGTLPKTAQLAQQPLGTLPVPDDEDTQPILPAPADDAS
jgi:hypothetical protein